jgi:Cft2 family RNA processing exonuclease
MTEDPGSPPPDETFSEVQSDHGAGDSVERVVEPHGGIAERADGDETLLMELGVFPQLLGLSTGMEDAIPRPSRQALELLINPAVSLAIDLIIDHASHCHRPATCPHIPAPLRPFAKMRRPALNRNRDLIARTLLQFPNHDLTNRVRNRFFEIDQSRDDHEEFVQSIESGAILTAGGLRDLLSDSPQENAQRLGTLLWARGLHEPREYAFFELLRLIAHEPPGASEPKQEIAAVQPSRGEKRRERKDQQQRIKALEAEISDLKRDRRRQAEARRTAEEARTQANEELAAARTQIEELSQQIETGERNLRFARADAQSAAKDLAKASDAASAARELGRDAQAERDTIEQARSLAVRELAIRRREIEVLGAKLQAIPTGKHAVHAFLEEEDQRIETALTIAPTGIERERAAKEHALHKKLEEAFKAAYPEFIPPRPVLRTEPARLELTPLGGADEIGRSAYFLSIADYSILIDCGIKVGKDDLDEIAPRIDGIEHIDAIVLTHAHTDHLGWLPALVHRFPDVDIYCTPETAELVPIMLDDCQRHHFAMMHRLKERSAYSSEGYEVTDPYEPEDVRVVEDLLVALPYGEVENFPSSDLRLTFFRAGHVLGAASALIEGEGRRVLMGGDISDETQLTVGAARWSDIDEVDLLVLESTYGDKSRDPLVEQHRRLVEFVAGTVSRNGSVILPCFGLGRGQEVALLLAQAMERGDLPPVSVWIDGMIRKINRVYERHCPTFSLPRENFFEVEAVHDRLYAIEEAQRQPTLIVTTSGMLAGGPAVEYARALLPDARNRIVLTGYQDEGNPGRALLNLTKEGSSARKIYVPNEEGEPIEIVAAAPAELFQLSAHADQTGLVESAVGTRPRHIVLVHGDPDRQRPLSGRLQSELPGATVEYGSLRTFGLR